MTDTIRATKRADELERGDWFRPDFQDFYTAAVVRHVEAYPADPWNSRVLLLYRASGQQAVETHRFAADQQITMLTDAEINRAMDVDRRELIAEQLAEVARLVRNPAFPLPKTWRAVDVTFEYEDAASIAACATVLGVERRETDMQVYAQRAGANDFSAGVELSCVAYRRADPTGQLYSRADDADDPTPVSPARVPLHTGGALVDETGCTHGVTTCRCADADTVPVPAEDATLTPLPESEGEAR